MKQLQSHRADESTSLYIQRELFLEKQPFHCFSGKPDKRKAAIKRIKDERKALETNDTEENESN